MAGHNKKTGGGPDAITNKFATRKRRRISFHNKIIDELKTMQVEFTLFSSSEINFFQKLLMVLIYITQILSDKIKTLILAH